MITELNLVIIPADYEIILNYMYHLIHIQFPYKVKI